MSLSFAVLGSGSSGNCTLCSFDVDGVERHVLIDAGFSPRMTTKRLSEFGVTLDDIDGILVTHFDGDHFYQSWPNFIERHNIVVHCAHNHCSRAVRIGVPGRQLSLFEDVVELGQGVHADVVPMAHDQLGTMAFIVNAHDVRLGFATDLGRVGPKLQERFCRLDALAVESNYDRTMQLYSQRPDFLKARIMGGAGHLSNQQSFEFVRTIASSSPLQHVVMLHLSRQCNDPEIINKLYQDNAPELLERLTISNQTTATPRLHVTPDGRNVATISTWRAGEQARLF